MAKTMERILAEVAGREIFLDKISTLLDGLKSQLEDESSAIVFERFAQNRNKLQIALQNVGPMPEPETAPVYAPEPKSAPPKSVPPKAGNR